MSNLDKRYTLKLDTKSTFFNPTPQFSLSDNETSDMLIRVTNNNKLIDMKGIIVVMVAIDPNGIMHSDFVELQRAEEGLLYCNLNQSLKNVDGTWKARLMCIYREERIVTSTFSYKVNTDEFVQLNQDVVTDDRFGTLTEMLSRLSTIELLETNRQEAENSRVVSENNRVEEFEVIKEDYNTYKNVMISESNVAALQKNINDNSAQIKEKANEVDLDIERKRIDGFTTLAEGSTTGDAELIDARVGADGFIYTNLGNSIRNQIRKIKELIGDTNTYIKNNVDISSNQSNGCLRGNLNETIYAESQTYYQNSYIHCIPGEEYEVTTIRSTATNILGYVLFTKGDDIIIGSAIKGVSVSDTVTETFKVPSYAEKMWIMGFVNANNFNKIQCNRLVKESAFNVINSIESSLKEFENNLDKRMANSSVQLISRQGEIGGYPENSRYGIKCAFENGYNKIRVSVNMTADNIPVLCHDISINRLARNMDGTEIADTLNLRDLTLEQVNAYDWGRISNKEEIYGSTITTLQEYLEYSRNYGIETVIELKEAFDETQARIVAEMIVSNGLTNYITIKSDNATSLTNFYNVCNRFNYGFIGHFNTNLINKITPFKNQNNSVSIECYKDDYALFNINDVLTIKNDGINIVVGNVGTADDLRKWAKLGVDGIEVAYLRFPATYLK